MRQIQNGGSQLHFLWGTFGPHLESVPLVDPKIDIFCSLKKHRDDRLEIAQIFVFYQDQALV